ncbi:hypothetical protein A3H74_03520 [Candidatus Kaiserbacteria bacterium RIFCSPLOWO2_02_FULL_51_13]|uniref:Uncharacterized protein n=1 Tax=Candidatus Kaiserbacteria bacterium RIFCSPLOWO2_01_FULL_50_24 TaxID=1798507 RepID=A0A1F6EQZ4_9BACT|nr:MAG: hypothetical protein A3A34_00105 [Candidatus Kaiserbacteria bacterium RIFCSPLOWO2_01_FULL_50_24]OGG82047.1 MAG: hypothetical protein A3H74_03520 [Candidatus Kaiserbacteria bacterium RIFCSPLOWO2_02_FULL_51_13]
MEPVIKSSFIPTDAEPVRAARRAGGMTDLLVLVALVLFVASLALAAGVFLYAQYLETSRASKSAQLERARATFEPTLIQTLTRLDDRMRAADTVLGAHIAPSTFFHVLEQVTLRTISFRTLAFDAADPKRISIRMRGVAESVNSIALQADLFTKNGVITSPIFTNIDRRIDGVNFDVSALINSNALRYATLFASAAAFNQTAEQKAFPLEYAPEGKPDPFGTQEE